MEAEDRTFGVSFSSEGLERLRELVMEKLKVFMGDYTDDTLVEYIIVLLKNGRSKNEAKIELNVFLGDDSDSFISWLWDHLGSNLSLYAQPIVLHSDGAPKAKYADREQTERNEIMHVSKKRSYENLDNEKLLGLAGNEPKNELPIPKNSKGDNVYARDESRQKVDQAKQSLSLRSSSQKNRKRNDVRHTRKEREVSRPNVSAPRRLLQFAVRDAVGTSKPVNLTTQPSLKRLRSVVSTSIQDSSVNEHPKKIRKTTGLRTDMSAAVKAASDAVKDVTRARSSRNVLGRLGDPTIASDVTTDHGEYRKDPEDNDYVYEKDNFLPAFNMPEDGSLPRHENVPSFDDNVIDALDFGNVNEGYEDDDVLEQRGTTMSRSDKSLGNWMQNSESQYEADNCVGKKLLRPRKELDQSAAVPSTSFRIAASVNLNTWKSPQQQEARGVSEMDDIVICAKSEGGLTKEKSIPLVASNGNAQDKLDVRPQHDPQKNLARLGLGSTCLPTENADSRTVFVSNVHFAATKDSLSRHFNKFGEVLKVNILSDPSTGQPKGSAYVEFMRKEAAEHALSLDGTSFLSRILKIVRKNSTPLEASNAAAWSRVRTPPFVGPSIGRIHFGRGTPSLYRARIPVKPGARSFQWKRESSATQTLNQGFNNIGLPATPRSLTYVRTEHKANWSSGNA